MILYLGEKRFFDFISGICSELSETADADSAEKIIIAEYSEKAKNAVITAKEKNIPLLGIADGYKSVVEAFGGNVVDVENKEGIQEWAVIDATSPIYLELESVIKVCLAKPFAIDEKNQPKDLDVMSRSEKGYVLAMRSMIAPKKYGNIFIINYYPDSPLTPDGTQIIKNFVDLQN